MSVCLKNRSQQIEIMDNLNCSGDIVDQTLRELEIINRRLGGTNVTLQGIESLLKNNHLRELTLADIGCGGGDILKQVAAWGMKNNLKLDLIGIDANPGIISFARTNTSAFGNIHYETLNILSNEFRNKQFDIVLATLFTHHFSNDELVSMFKSLLSQARVGVVINDIHRHWLAYHSIRFLTKFFSKSPMVKYDAPLSVLRAFRRNELKTILAQAGITNYSLTWHWAFRWQLIIPAN